MARGAEHDHWLAFLLWPQALRGDGAAAAVLADEIAVYR